jgi:hypothetical protein
MARSLTKLLLRTRVQQEADIVNTTFITAGEVDAWVDASYGELWERVLQAGIPIGIASDTIAGADTTDYALPTLWLATRHVYWLNGTNWVPIRRIPVLDEPAAANLTGNPRCWLIVGTNLRIYPAPSSAYSMKHIYVTQATDITGGIDTLAVNMFNATGERITILGAVIACKEKAEESTASLKAERERLFEVFLDSMMQIHNTESQRIHWVGPLGMDDDRPTQYDESWDPWV